MDTAIEMYGRIFAKKYSNEPSTSRNGTSIMSYAAVWLKYFLSSYNMCDIGRGGVYGLESVILASEITFQMNGF